MGNTIKVLFSRDNILQVEEAFEHDHGRLPIKSDFEKIFIAIIFQNYPDHEVVKCYETENPYSLTFEIRPLN